MNIPFNNLALFFLSLGFGILMIAEGFIIIKLQKQLIPLPTRILHWISTGLAGKEKSAQWFAGKNTPANQRTYAAFALFFGTALVISSFVYLSWVLS